VAVVPVVRSVGSRGSGGDDQPSAISHRRTATSKAQRVLNLKSKAQMALSQHAPQRTHDV